MEHKTLYWDKYECRHKRVKDCSLDHIREITNELEHEINLRLWDELPPFEAKGTEAEQLLAWRLAFMDPRMRRVAQILHRFGVRV